MNIFLPPLTPDVFGNLPSCALTSARLHSSCSASVLCLMFSTSSQKLSIDKLSKESTLEVTLSDNGDTKGLFGGSWFILQGQCLVLREEEIRKRD